MTPQIARWVGQSIAEDKNEAESHASKLALDHVKFHEGKNYLLGPYNWGYLSPDLPEDCVTETVQ